MAEPASSAAPALPSSPASSSSPSSPRAREGSLLLRRGEGAGGAGDWSPALVRAVRASPDSRPNLEIVTTGEGGARSSVSLRGVHVRKGAREREGLVIVVKDRAGTLTQLRAASLPEYDAWVAALKRQKRASTASDAPRHPKHAHRAPAAAAGGAEGAGDKAPAQDAGSAAPEDPPSSALPQQDAEARPESIAGAAGPASAPQGQQEPQDQQEQQGKQDHKDHKEQQEQQGKQEQKEQQEQQQEQKEQQGQQGQQGAIPAAAAAAAVDTVRENSATAATAEPQGAQAAPGQQQPADAPAAKPPAEVQQQQQQAGEAAAAAAAPADAREDVTPRQQEMREPTAGAGAKMPGAPRQPEVASAASAAMRLGERGAVAGNRAVSMASIPHPASRPSSPAPGTGHREVMSMSVPGTPAALARKKLKNSLDPAAPYPEPLILADETKAFHEQHPDEPIAHVHKKLKRYSGKKPARSFKVNVMGEVIFKGHPSWVLMTQMQVGLRSCLSRRLTDDQLALMRKPDCHSSPALFHTPDTVRFPMSGSESTPKHMLGDFKFKDYCPLAFRYIRGLFGIERPEYIWSLCLATPSGENALRLMATPGKSGSLFFFSHDMRFILKTIPKAEAKLLRAILPPYIDHLTRNPNTLLPRFYGLHRVKPHKGRQVRFVVMANLFATSMQIHERFDLKGSTLGRYVEERERAARGRCVTLKDQNWLEMGKQMKLGAERKALLVQQLQRDTSLLRKLGIMDYSLLIGFHYPELVQEDTSRPHSDSTATRVGAAPAPAAAAAAAAAASSSAAAVPSPVVGPTSSPSGASALGADTTSSAGQAPASPAGSRRPTSEFLTADVDLQPRGRAMSGQKPMQDAGQGQGNAAMEVLGYTEDIEFNSDDAVRPAQLPTCVFMADDGGLRSSAAGGPAGPEHYFVGIIDILMLYTARKVAEHAYKTIRFRAGKGAVSSCPPDDYAERFLQFMNKIAE
eukprot:m51a1_g2819 putative phosphatidylinositol phosphate kinase (970) ;mRNA; r:171394-174895